MSNGPDFDAKEDLRQLRLQGDIWKLVNELRSTRKLEFPELLKEAKARGLTITWRDLGGIIPWYEKRRLGAFFPPAHLLDFIVAYAKGRGFKKALDPFAGTGTLLTALVDSQTVEKGFGIINILTDLSIAQAISEGLPIDWLQGNPEEVIPTLPSDFDVVVGLPRYGGYKGRITLVAKGAKITVVDTDSHLQVLQACLLLSSQGEGLFVLPNAFFLNKSLQSVWSALPKLGLQVNAVLALPEGAFAPQTSISSNLVFISRKFTEQLFVGHLNPAQKLEPLLANLVQRRPGRVRELGMLVEPSSFTTWRDLALDEIIEGLGKKSGVAAVLLAEIADAINLGDRSEDAGFPDRPNSVFLPLIGTSQAVTSKADFKIKPHNYVQIILRPDTASAEYLAGFFNSTLGRKVRERLTSGSYIPKITKKTLMTSSLFLPPIETQLEIVGTHRAIQELTLRLQDLEVALWSRPKEVKKVNRELSALGQRDSFETWMERLPFPLASILRRYQADAEADRKNEHLLNFFEAAAQFLTTLMLSASYLDKQFFDDNKAKWLGTDGPLQRSLRRSSFGDWVIIGERLAKDMRRLLSDKETRDYCLGFFKTRRVDEIEALVSKELFGILKTVNAYRNDWKGHGGVVSRQEQRNRLDSLEEELIHIRKLLSHCFEEWSLISPGVSKYEGGLYDYKVRCLMGSNPIFQEIHVGTLVPMDVKKLYILDLSERNPLELLPFLRIMPSPKTAENACYFYNRIDKNNVRWISYHFEQESEIVNPDQAVFDLLQELEKKKINKLRGIEG
jgi:hypothetical protein